MAVRPVERGKLKVESSVLTALDGADLLGFLNDGRCPDCRTLFSMLKGPRGGLCTNIKCRVCGSEFNVALPIFAERI